MIIAEIGTSHEGSEKKAKELVDLACECGADAIKFQWVYADEILHPATGFVKLPTGNIPLYERFRALELDAAFYRRMCDYVHKKGKLFCCSPFGKRSLFELLQIEPDIVKVASPELNHTKMLGALADYRASQSKKVPVVLSSGVSTLADIERAFSILGKDDVTLLHCITSYPAPESEYNVRLVENLSRIFGVRTGVSDHSLDPILVPSLSVAFGGSVIEKHITISKKTSGLDDPVALDGEQFALMVHVVHQCEAALLRYGQDAGRRHIFDQLSQQYGEDKVNAVAGSGVKELAPSETLNYGRTNRSLHYMRDIKKGERILEGDIAILRTEKVLSPGISPDFFDLLVGKTIFADVTSGDGVQLSDFMEGSSPLSKL